MSQATQLPVTRSGPRRAAGQRRDRPEVSAARWPDVARVPAAAVQAAIARRLLRLTAAGLPIRVEPAGGRPFGGGEPGAPTMLLHRPGDFYRRIGAHGLIGFGESYMAGDWDCADLAGFLTLLCTRIDRMVPRAFQWLRRLYVARRPADWDADETGARRNVHQHYDLSNDMFALFLDESMTYSAGLFSAADSGSPSSPRGEPGSPALAGQAAAGRLAAAQRRKIDRVLNQAGVTAGSRVLEIGTGWGELAIRAAARGAIVHTVTLSAEQAALARRRIAAAGVASRATVAVQDYREVTGQFDAIVSVEMIEAVSDRYWPDYFRALDRLLAPGGKIGLQAITMPHRRMLATRNTKTWILKYIFPGGLIPSVESIEDNLRRHTGLGITGRHEFGPDYASTLEIWRSRFTAAHEQLTGLGFDQVFRRMWELYLAYSEAGFRARYLNVWQFQLQRPGGSA